MIGARPVGARAAKVEVGQLGERGVLPGAIRDADRVAKATGPSAAAPVVSGETSGVVIAVGVRSGVNHRLRYPRWPSRSCRTTKEWNRFPGRSR
jgi:hypothetical protein